MSSLATERARKRMLSQIVWAITVSVVVSVGIWTLQASCSDRGSESEPR
jgi:hypothetical protein